jgi:hypothetical protein
VLHTDLKEVIILIGRNPIVGKILVSFHYRQSCTLRQDIQVAIWIDHVKYNRLALFGFDIDCIGRQGVSPPGKGRSPPQGVPFKYMHKLMDLPFL